MKFLFSALVVALGAALTATAAVDDDVCRWKISPLGCHPSALCSYQFKLGDLTPSQSCRVKAGVNKLPQQLHLSFAGSIAGTGMTVSWATFDDVADSAVWLGSTASSLVRLSTPVSRASYYSEGDYSLFQNHAVVSGLSPNTKYFFKVGSAGDAALQSEVSSFRTARAPADPTAFTVAIYGDAGDGKNSVDTISYVNSLGDGAVDFIYHIGDISYADDDFLVPAQALGFFYEEVWNKWMNSLTPIMQQVPYMVSVGNHEAECHSPNCQLSSFKKDRLGNYTAYNARFKMPSKESGGVLNMWYSFEHGPLHITTLSSETDYPDAPKNQYTLTGKNGNFGNQLAWLEADLKKAAANRANVPWLIVAMHRPIYHIGTVDKAGQPTKDAKTIQAAFEELFLKYGVDVVLAGHEHSYERHLPIARGAAVTAGVSADKKTYTNPKAPVYIVTGAAGNVEDHKSKPSSTAAWNVVSDFENFGISTVTVSRGALEFKFIASASKKELDSFVITKS
ncbi:hypothetical protein PybrP1_010035 [[Pythium] brassicae (nom. inval.)]|nr:hypothetical protein PybrP1_010035 [[Pythium] brassicae (nom. inval.)]